MILELKDLFSKAGSTGYKQYFAPGRVNLIGEHIDYNGGLVMPIAINQGIKGIFKENPESLIQLKSTTHSDLSLFTAETIPEAYSSEIGW